MVIKGFSFGILLQIAVGPVCIFIIKTALESGFFIAMSGVLAVTLVDAVFVSLAIIGIGGLMKSDKTKKVLKIIGGIVIIYYGISILLTSFNILIMPSFSSSSTPSSTSAFITALILTISSPLTILFWAGVFGAKIADNKSSYKSVALFGLGAVLSTLSFLGAVAVIFSIFTPVMTDKMIDILNIIAGVVLFGFGVYMLIRKTSIEKAPA
jgi:threonine/homoserine/homoserine lactone efflux protein